MPAKVRESRDPAYGVLHAPDCVELGTGVYDNVHRVALAERDRPVVLRVAPARERQFRSERRLMRNEHAGLPWLAPVAHLMPQVIAADWTGQMIGRDRMIQTCLDGVPAPERLGSYPRSTWPSFFRRMGVIARAVHDVRGPWLGAVAGPGYATWSEAVIASLEDIAADLDGGGWTRRMCASWLAWPGGAGRGGRTPSFDR